MGSCTSRYHMVKDSQLDYLENKAWSISESMIKIDERLQVMLHQLTSETSILNTTTNPQERTDPTTNIYRHEDTAKTQKTLHVETCMQLPEVEKPVLQTASKQATVNNYKLGGQQGNKLVCITDVQIKEEENDDNEEYRKENESVHLLDGQLPDNDCFKAKQRQKNHTETDRQTLHQNREKEAIQDEKSVEKGTQTSDNEDGYMENKSPKTEKDVQLKVFTKELKETQNKMSSLIAETKELASLIVRNDKTLPGKRKFKDVGDVQILDKRSGTIEWNAIQELIDRLRNTIKPKTFQLQIIHCSKPSEVKREIPLLVICFAVSRIGSDALEAIDGVHDLDKAMLLIFHHTQRQVQASKETLKVPQLQTLGGRILDFAFNDEDGLNPCKMNEQSIEEVAEFIRKCYSLPI